MPKHYAYIDSLRGWAVAAVIVVHVGQISSLSAPLNQLTNVGTLGVQLFYIASAVTLMFSMASRNKEELRPIQNFFVRRFFRIAPTFYLFLSIYLCWFGLGPRYWAPRGINLSSIAATALFINGWRPDTINSIVFGQWSIAVEMSFYLALPLLFFLIRSFWASIWAWILSIFMAIALRSVATKIGTIVGYSPTDDIVAIFQMYWFPSQLPIFISGIGVYFALKKNISLRRFLAVYLTGGLLSILVNKGFHAGYRTPFYGTLLAILTFLLSRFPTPILVNSATKYLGKISFSAYLAHPLVIHVLEPLFFALHLRTQLARLMVFYALTLTITIAVSTLIWRFIELPFQDFGKRLISKREQRYRDRSALWQQLSSARDR